MLLINSLKFLRDSDAYPFHMPGHKRRLAGDKLLEDIYGIDITEIDGYDDLHDAKGIIKEAEERAAKCFGADETHFLVNGSTGGILAAITAMAREGDAIVIAGNCHRSVYNAVMLSGAKPYVITPENEAYFEICGGISAEEVRAAIEKAQNPAAVVITSPTYEGIVSDISAVADICHKNNTVLIVDAAHGAHFGFSPSFPQSAVTDADIVITSVHKTLPAMTQTALIHISGKCPGRERLRRMLSVFMTSSPSYVLMSSIDSLTDLLTKRGTELFDAYEKRLDDLYVKVGKLENLSILCKDKLTAAGSADFDRSKIVISDTTGTFTGGQLSAALKNAGIYVEMAASSYVVLMTSIADTDEGFSRLYDALVRINDQIGSKVATPGKRNPVKRLWDRFVGKRIAGKLSLVSPGCEMSHRIEITEYENNMKAALFDDNAEYIPVELAEGRTAKDMVSIYPPGIPVTVPGEKITGEEVDRILSAIADGLEIKGLKEKEIAVLWEKSST